MQNQKGSTSVVGQTEKNSVRAYVFRFALKLGHCSTHSACLKGAMYGRRPRCKRNLTFQRSVRVQSCIRPLNAATLAAGPDVIR